MQVFFDYPESAYLAALKFLHMSTSPFPLLTTWVELPKNTDFTIYNLPFGVFKSKKLSPRIGMAIGDQVIDLSILDQEGFFSNLFLPDRKSVV